MAEEPCLVRRLKISDEDAFHIAVAKWTTPGFDFAPEYKPGVSFTAYLDLLTNQEKGIDLPEGYVPHTVLYAFDGETIVGRAGLRHRLNEFLTKIGGHIGYGVLPEFRMKGFATSMLRQTLPFARALGISKVLVTCDEFNVGSYKVIEKCGGVLENIVDNDGQGNKRRYWIKI